MRESMLYILCDRNIIFINVMPESPVFNLKEIHDRCTADSDAVARAFPIVECVADSHGVKSSRSSCLYLLNTYD